MDEIIRIVKEYALETGNHPPVVFVYGTENKGVILLKGGDTPEARQSEMFGAGRKISCERDLGKLRLVYHVSEAWMASANNGMLVRPSEDPERIEVMVFGWLDFEENKQSIEFFKMVRDAHGKLTDLWAMHMFSDTEVQSNMLDAFMAGYQSTSRADQ